MTSNAILYLTKKSAGWLKKCIVGETSFTWGCTTARCTEIYAAINRADIVESVKKEVSLTDWADIRKLANKTVSYRTTGLT